MIKRLIKILLVFAILGSIVAYFAYTFITKANVNPERDKEIFYIPSDASYDDLIDTLVSRNILANTNSFHTVAKVMKFGPGSFKSGRYQVDKTWSNRTLINVLRSGNQKGKSLVINNVRTIFDLMGSIGRQLEMDSLTIHDYLMQKSTLDTLGFTKENILSLFIPNTYEVWWNSSPEKLIERLKSEHDKWWQQNQRSEKIRALGLSKTEVYTLASIVDKESNLNKEKPRVAGVYYNRIKKGIPLQADPTVVFATGQFGLRRVLNKHLAFDSPYNTYLYRGLPPGPIFMASIDGLNAVINLENHDYLYFCAAPGYGSEHLFAKTLTQHNRNARKFHSWLNKQGIK